MKDIRLSLTFVSGLIIGFVMLRLALDWTISTQVLFKLRDANKIQRYVHHVDRGMERFFFKSLS